ncbi:hypothetical protein SUGI_0371580 [Cryptomeria japonica]|nr:hypothetical protein SUGI_0371580 [Cryptomeria japonica]
MQKRALGNEKGLPSRLNLRDTITREVTFVEISRRNFSIGHETTTMFLGEQLDLDSDGYIITEPGTMKTSTAGVFSASFVLDELFVEAPRQSGEGVGVSISALKEDTYPM